MGELDLEKRLQRLNTAYEDIPTVTTSDSIIDFIKQQEQPSHQQMRWWQRYIKLPYVASFLGILVIGALLAGELLSQPEGQYSMHSGDSAAKDEAKVGITEFQNGDNGKNEILMDAADKQAFIDQLHAQYDQQLKHLQEGLQTDTDLTEYSFVQQANDLVQSFEQAEFQSQSEMRAKFEETKSQVSVKLAIPSEMISMITLEQKKLSQAEVNDLLSELLVKQQELLPLLQQKWVDYNIKNPVDYTMVDELNQTSSLDDPELSMFAQSIRANAYRFVDEGEGMVGVAIDYERLNAEFPDSSLAGYYELIPKLDVARDAELIVSWNELSEVIVQLEQFMLEDPGFIMNKDIYIDYQRLLQFYLHGIDNSPVFHDNGLLRKEVRSSYERFLETYPDTETYVVIKWYMDLLEKNHFTRTDEVKNAQIPYPQLIK